MAAVANVVQDTALYARELLSPDQYASLGRGNLSEVSRLRHGHGHGHGIFILATYPEKHDTGISFIGSPELSRVASFLAPGDLCLILTDRSEARMF